MQQRQLRLGDVLDDYCPRERRVTNHAVVAMIGDEVKQTRCTACEAEHEYKHAKVPRQRRKTETPAALYAQVLAGGPKKVTHESPASPDEPPAIAEAPPDEVAAAATAGSESANEEAVDRADSAADEEGPVHRPLIRASLPKIDGQPPPARPIPEFTVRQPGGRHNRFRPRRQGGGGQQGQYGQRFSGDRSNGNNFGQPRGGGMRPGGGRPPQGHPSSRPPRHRGGGGGQKRSK